MNKPHIDISSEPVKFFLDAADAVLNSNTFLLQFDIDPDKIEKSFLGFLNSEYFMEQLVFQDIKRGWNCMRYYDNKTENYELRRGNILKDNIKLKISRSNLDKREYLIAMLTGDTTKGSFFSFYGKQLERKKAEVIVDNMTSFISENSSWDLFIVHPDFLKNSAEVAGKGDDLYYFEGGNANDTATIIRYSDRGFLILTNGID